MIIERNISAFVVEEKVEVVVVVVFVAGGGGVCSDDDDDKPVVEKNILIGLDANDNNDNDENESYVIDVVAGGRHRRNKVVHVRDIVINCCC